MKRYRTQQGMQARFLMAAVPLTALLIAAFAFANLGAAAQPGSSDLNVVKSDSPDPVHVGGHLTYTIGVPRKAGTIRNTATVKGEQKDPVKANNKATVRTSVLG